MIYVGEFPYKIDDQRRVPVPKDWRSQADKPFYLVPGTNRSIEVLEAEEFERDWVPRAQTLEPGDAKAHRTMMNKMRLTSRVMVDGQNRIKLDAKLMEHAQLTNELVMIGGVNRFYFVNPENAEKIRNDEEID